MNEYLNKLDCDSIEVVELRVIDIDGYDYKLENENSKIITINMDIYGDNKIKVDDYIYMFSSIIDEANFFQFGPIYNRRNEIIKVVSMDKSFYLQRYYG